MVQRFWSTLKGSFASLVLATNAIAICSGMLPFALVKLALPFAAVRRVVDRVLMALAQGWVAGNGWWMALVRRTRWDVQGLEGLRRKGWAAARNLGSNRRNLRSNAPHGGSADCFRRAACA